MPRTSPIHYIAPSVISITPNANGSADDLAVYIADGSEIQVYCPQAGIDMVEGEYQKWTIRGRNRRLADDEAPYTVYARLPKKDKSAGYLVFAKKAWFLGAWLDKYVYLTPNGNKGYGVNDDPDNWYIRLGEVSLPENNQRTLDYDTGVLGTDQFNTEWALNPDSLPLRIDISCTIDDEDAGPAPYVYWDQALMLTALLTEGWTGTDIERFDHWEIARNTGNSDADSSWPSPERAAEFAASGTIQLTHSRGADDDFGGAVSTVFTVTAWGREQGSDSSSSSSDSSSSGEPALVPMKSASINIMAETIEKYEMAFSASIVSYNPQTGTYNPGSGVAVRFRATDQRGEVFILTKKQFEDMALSVAYAPVGSDEWTELTPAGADTAPATVTVPVTAFASQESINVRLENSDGKELATDTIAFVRDGEDSKVREWIFLRSTEPVTFGTSEHPYPSDISRGEVNPAGAAGGYDTNKNQDGWVPEGWWDEMQGTDEDYPYEYCAYRDYVRDAGSSSSDSSSSDEPGGHWGDFTVPKMWSHFGKDGQGAATCFFERSVLNVTVDTSRKVLEDFHADVPFYMVTGKERLFISSAEINEEGTTKYARLSHNSLFVPDGDGRVVNHTAVINGTGIRVEGHTVIINNERYRYAYTMVTVDVKKGTILDEHLLGLSVIAEDGDGNEYAGYADMAIQAKYVAKDGTNVKRLDIDNEMDAIQTDSSGKVIRNTTIETVVRLYDGNDEVIIDNPTVSGITYTEGSTQKTLLPTITTDGKGKKLSWTFLAGWFIQPRYEVGITYTFGGTQYSATLSLMASMGQAIFQLKPSLSVVPFARNSSGGFIDQSKPLTLQIVKLDGGAALAVDAATYGLSLIRYSKTVMPATASAGTAWPGNNGITVDNTDDNVFIALFDASGNLLDRETVPVIKDGVKGAAGDSALVADLSNEMDSVPMTYAGAVAALTTLTTTFKMLYGTAVQTLTALTASGAASGVTVSCNSSTGVVTVSVAKDTLLANDKNVITITGTCAKGTLSADFTIAGVRGGANGEPAVMFNVLPSVDVIKKNKNGSLTPPSPMTCSVQKVSGSAVSTASSSDGMLRYRIDGDITSASQGTEMSIGGSVQYANTNSYITFAFFVDNVLRDKERVPIVADGADSTVPGPAGDDAISVIVTPASLIVNQDIQHPNNLSTLSEQILFSVMEGSTAKNVSKVEITYIEEYSDSSSSSSGESILKCAVTGSDSYYATLTAIGKDENNNYFDQAYFICKVYYDNNSKSVENVKVKVYANLLGTWAETVEDGVKTETAKKLSYVFFGDEVHTIEQTGTYVRSWEENTSTLTKKVNNGKNLLSGVLTGNGWVSWATSSHTTEGMHNVSVDADGFFNVYSGDTYIICFASIQNQTDYCFSFKTKADAVNLNISWIVKRANGSGGNIASGTVEPNGTQNRQFVFRDSGSTPRDIRICINISALKEPQLELGTVATVFSAPTTETSSQIKQTASEIDMSVKNDYEEAGLKITASGLELRGGKVDFTGDDGLPYIKVSLDEQHIPHLIFMAPDGETEMYDLGYAGLQQITNNSVPDSWEAAVFQGFLVSGDVVCMEEEDMVNPLLARVPSTAEHIGDPGWFVEKSGHPVAHNPMGDLPVWQFHEGYTIINGQRIYNIGGISGPSIYDGKYYYTQARTKVGAYYVPSDPVNEGEIGWFFFGEKALMIDNGEVVRTGTFKTEVHSERVHYIDPPHDETHYWYTCEMKTDDGVTAKGIVNQTGGTDMSGYVYVVFDPDAGYEMPIPGDASTSS